MLPNLIVPVLNRYDLLDRMLDTIDYPIRHVLIIDNGGKYKETATRHKDWVDNTTVLNLPSNLGVAASWNLGIKLLPHDDRWTITSNDCYFREGALEKIAQAKTDRLTLMKQAPHWHTFVIGEEVVKKVGLASERFYPAYFEDNDWERRIKHHGYPVDHLEAAIHHDNSSTLHSDPDFGEKNRRSYIVNMNHYQNKLVDEDFNESPWELGIRRWNEWLPPR